MSAISETFARCRAEGRAAFVPFIVAGDPDLATTEELLSVLAEAGADLIEIGVPFSDPIADGPVIQAAGQRALAAGATLERILATIARVRGRLGVPLVLFSYANPILVHGAARFAEQAAASGVDGVLIVDLPPEEAAVEVSPALAEQGLDRILLLAPTSGPERIDLVAKAGSGFVYYVSRTGVTGEREALADELPRQLRAVRRRLRLPVVVGFGISTPAQVAAVAPLADGVVVGSALVRLLHDCRDEPERLALVAARARQLAAAVRPAAAEAGGSRRRMRRRGSSS
ncbi:MAG: tryptophan synthase subunit alpha [Thermoanaerobaculia bacterium]|nr:tryptophan synthase subunit alpha [Thermoanaerobaculia bacterium]MBP7812168.1 tryptophan synthase subunit alpha [Thermoanaerobaculia bacterium]MBP8845733.1 tryptophan synthase subunit alpha [Thermoanaerobaculia bacterium]HPA94680.1 tryptophan synthase subunit alpha [Thermoanaerobaculia bacterium]HRR13652.1 tryptophan synthase subunit alpha [Thermoanaerobaculia bacterium]